MYLFPASPGPGPFRHALAKDFHVSPFSSRKGSYALSTAGPADDGVSVTVTLRSSKGHPKLVARWWSDAPVLDPSDSSTSRLLWLLVSWSSTMLTTFREPALSPTTPC